MSIAFLESSRQFHLRNRDVSYVFRVLEGGELNHLYFGGRLTDDGPLTDLQDILFRDMLCVSDDRGMLSLEQIRQEYPVTGSGDLRPCALTVCDDRGSHVARMLYAGHTIVRGKPPLTGLPATYVEDTSEAETLEITLRDDDLGLQAVLQYTIFEQLPVITRSVRLENVGGRTLAVEGAYSAALDLPDAQWDMLTLTNTWSRECEVERAPLRAGGQRVSSLDGRSSQHANPFVMLARPHTDELHGEAFAVSLAYSGNFDIDVTVDSIGGARLLAGINPTLFRWTLEPGGSFQTPEAIIAYSDHGMSPLSQTMHTLLRTRMARGPWRDRRRPVALNTYESLYMDVNERNVKELATEAADLGVELIVVDDGWFGERDWDDASLGDWTPHPRKFPNGLKPVADHVHGLGMKFGLWFEPEMVNPDSDLYRAHPDWVLGDTTRELSIGRHQYVLDLTRADVRDHIVAAMGDVIAANDVDYIKWNMNRSLSEVFSASWPADRQGEIYHRYVLGYYDLLSRLLDRFPNLLIEAGSGGGGRLDPAVLAFSPQYWISEDTDAMERVKIQYGTSFAYPLAIMSNHVTPVPNAQTGRKSSLKTRGDVAMFGAFGYELDPRTLGEEGRAIVREQIARYKEYADLLRDGDYYRLLDPFRPNSAFAPADAAWIVVSNNRREALVGYYRTRIGVNVPVRYLKLAGLDERTRYAVDEIGFDVERRPRYGDELERVGLSLTDGSNCQLHPQVPLGDNLSRIFHLHALEE
ncbi:alpha-galactosidase [Bifidobacterium ramosum]|uniref:Alpha-galactosidase n=1 Tax=Bifidobacterium ramosum TaxID=1798158 RepID=A0A6L4WX85_9BIFI|nr:alpha-galactosidase [Bifidobacterium ramosum]KAB8286611.1 alpha-galactosidase [Bifidobacterium ramosum]